MDVVPFFRGAIDGPRHEAPQVDAALRHERDEGGVEPGGRTAPSGLVLAALGIRPTSDGQGHLAAEVIGHIEERDPVGLRRLRLSGRHEHGLFADVPGLLADAFKTVQDHGGGEEVADVAPSFPAFLHQVPVPRDPSALGDVVPKVRALHVDGEEPNPDTIDQVDRAVAQAYGIREADRRAMIDVHLTRKTAFLKGAA